MKKFYEGLSDIFEIEVNELSSEFRLRDGTVVWDSLAILSTLALLDECFGVVVDGKELGECENVGDIEKLIAAAANDC
jgi:acyl carrier protein